MERSWERGGFRVIVFFVCSRLHVSIIGVCTAQLRWGTWGSVLGHFEGLSNV